ncbi:Endonuclease III-like protein [Aphelenchoides fujianensis]|nr:Endonuclease III-like protein [Aphelenchoides fujianensis]
MPPSTSRAKPVVDIEDIGNDARSRFRRQFPVIQKMRATKNAAVDTLGCHMLADRDAQPAVRRFQTFISLLLSPRTKDEKTAEAIANLRAHGLTVEKMIATPVAKIEQMIKMVGMWKTKAEYVKANSVVLRDRFNSDLADLLALRGVGPKIANLTLVHCYESDEYIGTDVHVHRIANRLWINTKTPEQTEEALKKIVPRDLWRDVNVALVGFGQTICKARPKCEECDLRSQCPVAASFLKAKKPKRSSN